ncbi:hypothetical protein ABT404_03420 [Streptomyces hyaluromycini]|uniref:Uncharacterized protein n=1 Tax=Streptomyces hyaluromycini TaxID=1377993 RepID=A0ABV1WNU1_9ACTN
MSGKGGVSGTAAGKPKIEQMQQQLVPRWVAGPVPGLGQRCSLRPRVPERTQDVRLGDTPRPSLRLLAALCTQWPVRAEIDLLGQVAARVTAARRVVQQHFPYGVGPVLGDLMPAGDGAGDLLRALAETFGEAFAESYERLPQRARACPWGAFDTAHCACDAFGRLVHDICSTPAVPDSAAAARILGRWMWRTVQAVEQGDLGRFVTHEVRLIPGARLEAGMIGPIRLVIGRDGPAQRAGDASGVLLRLITLLAPPHVRHPVKALYALHRHLQRWGATTWGRGFTARSGYTAALQARHTVVRHGDRPDHQLDTLTRILLGKDPDRWRARTAAGLLNPTWDDAPRPDAQVSALLNAALTAASADSKPEWEREMRHRFITMLDQPDALIPSDASAPAEDSLLEGFEDRIEWVLRQMEHEQRGVAIAYALHTDSTWPQAARRAGAPVPEAARVGEKVRRRLKYLSEEYNRRKK